MKLTTFVGGAAIAALLSAAPSQAAFVSLDLSSIVNSDLGPYTGGSAYPGPGPITIGGIDFNLADFGNGNTGVVGGLASVGTAQSYTVGGLNIADVTTMYAIINSAFGICNTVVGSIGAETASATDSFTLTEGINVRDHFQGNFCNAAISPFASASFLAPGVGTVLFDVYEFDLTTLTNNGADAVTDFLFDTFGQAGDGEPLLAAVTFLTDPTDIPAPGALVFLGVGLTGLVLARRRKIRSTA